MALIVIHHTVADNFDVDPDYDVSSDGRIVAGTLVTLDSDGFVDKADKTNPLGIAGDSLSDEYQTTAYSAELVISPKGAKRWTQNRIDNYFNETLASNQMTVYTGSGVFATSEFVATDTFAPGDALFSNAEGKFTTTDDTSRRVGFVKAAPDEYPSGVPGVDAPTAENSISLGTYLTVQLSI